MKKRSLKLGLKLLLAVLPAGLINAQTVIVDEDLYAHVNTSGEEKVELTKSTIRDNDGIQVIEEPGKMVFYYDNDVITLSYVNLEKQRVSLYVRDMNGELLYNENFRSPVVHNRLITAALPAGEYVAIFKTGKDEYKRTFKVVE